jgi:hypothetical protein
MWHTWEVTEMHASIWWRYLKEEIGVGVKKYLNGY